MAKFLLDAQNRNSRFLGLRHTQCTSYIKAPWWHPFLNTTGVVGALIRHPEFAITIIHMCGKIHPYLLGWKQVDSRGQREAENSASQLLLGESSELPSPAHPLTLASVYLSSLPLSCPTPCWAFEPDVDLLCRNWETSSSCGMLSSWKPQYFSRSGKMWLCS